MKQSLKRKYRFNLETGHYEKIIRLNEDDSSAEGENQESQEKEDSKNSEQPVAKQPLPNIETAEVAQLRQQLNNETNKINSEIKRFNDQLSQLSSKHSDILAQYNSDTKGTIDPIQVNKVQQSIIQIQKQIEDAKYKLATQTHDYNLKIFDMQSKLLESMYQIPGKYSILNESNIHSAKVYINSLVGKDTLIDNMVGVRHTFKYSQLFYGKDQNGYFVICIDQEDFDRMYKALTDVGYSREEIIDAIMPQVFDRRELVK